jgi:hypothetical protein
VYHFQSVTRLDGGLIPKGSGDDFEIPFHRHAITRELEPLHQCRQAQGFGNFMGLSVELNGHGMALPILHIPTV